MMEINQREVNQCIITLAQLLYPNLTEYFGKCAVNIPQPMLDYHEITQPRQEEEPESQPEPISKPQPRLHSRSQPKPMAKSESKQQLKSKPSPRPKPQSKLELNSEPEASEDSEPSVDELTESFKNFLQKIDPELAQCLDAHDKDGKPLPTPADMPPAALSSSQKLESKYELKHPSELDQIYKSKLKQVFQSMPTPTPINASVPMMATRPLIRSNPAPERAVKPTPKAAQKLTPKPASEFASLPRPVEKLASKPAPMPKLPVKKALEPPSMSVPKQAAPQKAALELAPQAPAPPKKAPASRQFRSDLKSLEPLTRSGCASSIRSCLLNLAYEVNPEMANNLVQRALTLTL